MSTPSPITELDPRYGDAAAEPTSWSAAETLLESAEIYWLATIHPEGRPHVTPIIGLWLDGAFHFTTGEEERKYRNLLVNPNCTITTGRNTMHDDSLDLVLEGAASRITDQTTLRRLAAAYKTKYDWNFTAQNGRLLGDEGNPAVVFVVEPITAFGFGKGKVFSQTRWRFTP